MPILVLIAFFELVLYQLIHAHRGFAGVHASVRNVRTRLCSYSSDNISKICEAVSIASCFYWRPVLCLQKAVVITRLLRRRGIPAEMVIGYRPSPFFSHSWVEVDGRIVNDSPAYQQKLLVLERL